MNRYDIVNAYAAFGLIHDDESIRDRVRAKKDLRDLSDVSLYSDADNVASVLDSIEETARAAYFGLVDKRLGRERANEQIDTYQRIGAKDGVTIHVENSDDDPTIVEFIIQDPIAGAWADRDQYIDGSSWEEADGPDFVYTITYWHPGLFDELRAEGYDLDFSNYSEPGEHDLAVATHAGDCGSCSGDWHEAEKHLQRIETEPLFNRSV